MKKEILSISLLLNALFFSSLAWADVDHSSWDNLLKQYVNTNGLVNYKELLIGWEKKDHPLKLYLKILEKPTKQKVFSWSIDEQKAFFINAYNAYTIALILDHYPVKSIKEIGKNIIGLGKGPWKLPIVKLFNSTHDLNWLEHKVLRGIYKDPRIHAAINCASIGCAKLQRFAFIGARLSEQLSFVMKEFINDETRNQFDIAKGHVHLSKIFSWFAEDFKPNVKDFLYNYVEPEYKKILKDKIFKIDFLEYDWSLNEQ